MRTPVLLLLLLILLPSFGASQSPQPIPRQPSMFETLSDSQWIRVSGNGHAHREARLLTHSGTEIVLDLDSRPVRTPLSAIDTLWERRSASRTGALVGGILGGVAGILVATQAVEEGENAPADYVGVLAVGGTVGGALLGALLGRAFPKWHRLYPR